MIAVPSIIIFGIDLVKFAVDLGNAYMLFLAVSLSLNLEAGYTGIPNFGKVMFMAGGAAISAAVSGLLAVMILGVNVHGNYNAYIVTVINQVNASLAKNPVLSVELILLGTILAAALGGFLGFLVSYPAIRLREDYLGMLLLASAQFFQIFLGAYYRRNPRNLGSRFLQVGGKRHRGERRHYTRFSHSLRDIRLRVLRKSCTLTDRENSSSRAR